MVRLRTTEIRGKVNVGRRSRGIAHQKANRSRRPVGLRQEVGAPAQQRDGHQTFPQYRNQLRFHLMFSNVSGPHPRLMPEFEEE